MYFARRFSRTLCKRASFCSGVSAAMRALWRSLCLALRLSRFSSSVIAKIFLLNPFGYVLNPDLFERAVDVAQELHALVMHLLAMLIEAQEDETLKLFEDSHGVFIVLITQGERPFDL